MGNVLSWITKIKNSVVSHCRPCCPPCVAAENGGESSCAQNQIADTTADTKRNAQQSDPLSNAIDQYVERWFEQNPCVDMGKINIPYVGEIDILPDHVEKAMYKRLHKLMITNLMQTEVCICGVKMRLQQIEGDGDGDGNGNCDCDGNCGRDTPST